jgi:glycosyltransferase involved in cell wall biosynthesis
MAIRVAVFTFEFPPSHSGGLGVHVGGLVDYLRQKGDAVDVFYLGQPPAPSGTLLLPALEGCLAGGPIDVRMVPGGETVLSRHECDPYDLVHCHDWHGALPASLLWQHRVPMITTSHLPAASRFLYSGERAAECSESLEALTLRLSDRVIAVSEFVAREIERKYRAFARKIRVILHGTDTALFAPSVGRRKPLVLAVGRLTLQKGFLDLPKIFASVHKKMPQARLRIIGAGADERMLRAAITESETASVTEVLSFCDRQALCWNYQQARVVVMPSVYEPFGLVAIEAMACGTPVIAYATGGLPEIITDGVDGILVAPNDRDGFASALLRLLGDQREAERLGERARQTVLNCFSDKVSYARTRALYAD